MTFAISHLLFITHIHIGYLYIIKVILLKCSSRAESTFKCLDNPDRQWMTWKLKQAPPGSATHPLTSDNEDDSNTAQ